MVDSRLVATPESSIWIERRAQLLAAVDRDSEAAQTLADALRRRPNPTHSRIYEGLLRRELQRGNDADAIALSRLEHAGTTLASALEAGEIHVRRGELREALERLRPLLSSRT